MMPFLSGSISEVSVAPKSVTCRCPIVSRESEPIQVITKTDMWVKLGEAVMRARLIYRGRQAPSVGESVDRGLLARHRSEGLADNPPRHFIFPLLHAALLVWAPRWLS